MNTDLIKKLYLEDKMNLTEVSNSTGYNRFHIYSFLKTEGLIRDWKESQKYRKLRTNGKEKEIEKLYLIDKKSMKAISDYFDMPLTTICRFIKKMGWSRDWKLSLKLRPSPSEKTRKLWSIQRKGGNEGSFLKGQISWCKGLTKETSDLVKRIGEKTSATKLKNGDAKKEKNPNWKGGITPFKVLFTHRKEYKRLIRSVFERDGFKCKICGGREPRLEAHHIKPFATYPEGRELKDNLITLCRICHYKTFQKEEQFVSQFQNLLWQHQ